MFGIRSEPAPKLGWVAQFSPAKRAAALAVTARNILSEVETPQDLCSQLNYGELATSYLVPAHVTASIASSILKDAVTGALSDSRLTTRERHELETLATCLGLDRSALDAALDSEAGARYAASVATALADGQLSEEEAEIVTRVQRDLDIEPRRATEMYLAAALLVMKRVMADASSDGLVTADEIRALEERAASLGIDVPDWSPEFSRAAVAQHIADGGPLPSIDPGSHLALQRGERLHLLFSAALSEHKHVTQRVDYTGIRANTRLMKGLSLYAGSVQRRAVQAPAMVPIDRGVAFFTSKRIVLDGMVRNHAVTWRSIIDFDVFSDGVRVGKANGGDLYYRVDDPESPFEASLYTAVLGRLTGGAP